MEVKILKTDNTIIEILNAKQGEITDGSLTVAYQNDNSPVSIPITIIRGQKSGPNLLILGGIHGIEIVTVEIARRLKEITNPAQLRGTVIIAPVINPYAFWSSTRYTPLDAMDMNRVFPGTTGSLTNCLARIICEKLINTADYVIDCHSCNPPSLHFTITGQEGTSEVIKSSLDMARAFGYPIVNSATITPGTISGYCMNQGKPCITPEFVFSRRLDMVSIETGVIGMLNVMKHLGMQDGEIEAFNVPGAFEEELTYRSVHAKKGGLVYLEKEVGQQVKLGESVATLRDLWGNQTEVITSPVDGIVIAYPLQGNQAAGTGDKVAYIAY